MIQIIALYVSCTYVSIIIYLYICDDCICLQVSTDNGYIEYFDVRGDKLVWQIKAHEKEVTGK